MQLTEMKDEELLKLVALDLDAAMKEGMIDELSTDGGPMCPVAERRRQGRSSEMAKLKKKGQPSRRCRSRAARSPRPSGARPGATTSSATATIENRLPRGRTYVRNGSVVDLQIAQGKVTALVSGSDTLHGGDQHRAASRRRAGRPSAGDCAGTDRLAGRAAAGPPFRRRHGRVCREGDGLFPRPARSSCPAAVRTGRMCKHVAAVLYGVGARLDASPSCCSACAGSIATSCRPRRRPTSL